MRKDKIFTEISRLLIESFGIPERSSEMPDPVDMMIATILSQNTNDRNSYKAFLNLKKHYPDWKTLSSADPAEIENIIRAAGLAKQKSRAIINFIHELLKKNGSLSMSYLEKFSDAQAIEELTGFAGVGVKTASCVLMFSMERNICPVDTHLHRVLNRIGVVKTSSPDKTFYNINSEFPDSIAHSFHTNLIKLGREICTPSKPACGIRPVSALCIYEGKQWGQKNGSRKNSFFLLDNVKAGYTEDEYSELNNHY